MLDSSPRSRGGQPGNTNALKHGFYTRRVPGLKTAALEALDTEFPGLEEEIFVLRAYIRKVLEWSAASIDYHENLLLLRTLCLAFSTLARLTREHRALTGQPIDTLATLREAHASGDASVSATQPPAFAFSQFLQDLFKQNPHPDEVAYFEAYQSLLPSDTFDACKSRQPSKAAPSQAAVAPIPFPTPVTMCAPQPSDPSPASEPAATSQPPVLPSTQTTSPIPDPVEPEANQQVSDDPSINPDIQTPTDSSIREIRDNNPVLALPALAYQITKDLALPHTASRPCRAPSRLLLDQLPKFEPSPEPSPVPGRPPDSFPLRSSETNLSLQTDH